MATDRCDVLCLDLDKAEALRRNRLDPAQASAAASGAKALADPNRLMLATALADGGELCVCDLAWIAERPDNLVSHHLRVLRDAGLVETRREHRIVFYSVTGKGRALVTTVLGASEAVKA